jgi:hypothetical protein
MWRRTERASLEKKPSTRLSQEPCLGVKVNSNLPAGCTAHVALGWASRIRSRAWRGVRAARPPAPPHHARLRHGAAAGAGAQDRERAARHGAPRPRSRRGEGARSRPRRRDGGRRAEYLPALPARSPEAAVLRCSKACTRAGRDCRRLARACMPVMACCSRGTPRRRSRGRPRVGWRRCVARCGRRRVSFPALDAIIVAIASDAASRMS